jgi:hypothetical protein
MVSRKLIKVIQNHSSDLARKWLQNVQKSSTTPTYHTFDEISLLERVHNVYANLEKWLEKENSQVERYYTDLGAERLEEGFKLSEVLSALSITRRVLWDHVLTQGLLDSALDLYQALELNNQVVLFFDKAAYYVAVGYEKAG